MVGVVINRNAGRGSAIKKYNEELKPVLNRRVKNFIEIIEDRVEYMQNKLENLIKNGIEMIVVVGGDGTLNRVSEVVKGRKVSIIPFPAGTGNDFIKSMGKHSVNSDYILRCINGKCTKKDIDIGYVETEKGRHIFINGLGIGFDADVLKTIMKLPLLKGDLLYFAAVLLNLFKRKLRKFRLIANGVTQKKEFVVFDVGNGRYLGGGFKLFPESDFQDGRLSYIGIRNAGLFRVIKVLIDVLRGKLRNNPLIELGEFESIKLEFEEEVAYHTDGDLREEARFFEIGLCNEKVGVMI